MTKVGNKYRIIPISVRKPGQRHSYKNCWYNILVNHPDSDLHCFIVDGIEIQGGNEMFQVIPSNLSKEQLKVLAEDNQSFRDMDSTRRFAIPQCICNPLDSFENIILQLKSEL